MTSDPVRPFDEQPRLQLTDDAVYPISLADIPHYIATGLCCCDLGILGPCQSVEDDCGVDSPEFAWRNYLTALVLNVRPTLYV